MAFIRMVGLTRKRDGSWYARKVIPADVRDAYAQAHSKRREEFFVRPATLPRGVAEREFDDWKSDLVGRIERLRAKARGVGEDVTLREAYALAGEWYKWFVAGFDQDPDTPEQWDYYAEQYEEIIPRAERRSEHDNALLLEDSPRSPSQRRAVHRFLADRGNVERFLAETRRTLSDKALGMLLDAMEPEFLAVLQLLHRRAEGDWSRDARPERFPAPSPSSPRALPSGVKPSGLTCWGAFELWIETRKPAISSIDRWRAVFNGLRAKFGERDIATITADEAQAWIDELPNEERSAQTVLEIWLRAARTVFAWAVKKKRLPLSPFADASLPLPKRPPKLRRKHYGEEEWRTILGATLEPPPRRMATHKAAARRWVPWLCAYTGCRPGEACQLRAEDIYQHPLGFWVMRITPEAGTVKDGEARQVPLHEHLVAQGFPAFAKGRRSGPLFYDPKAAREATPPLGVAIGCSHPRVRLRVMWRGWSRGRRWGCCSRCCAADEGG
jgi:integrase